ncbi:putative membrane protein YdjX (TVP38/TMEM64 family) [Constrictibacter sp. MBR-5]
MAPGSGGGPRPPRTVRQRLLVGLAVSAALGLLLVVWFALPIDEWMLRLEHWVERLGMWGFAAFGLVYVLATVLLAPASALSIVAGLVFGVMGIPLVLAAATVGASAAFLIGRYIAQGKVQAMLDGRPRFAAIDRAVGDEGWKVVLLLRLSPLVPFNLQNYFFGITRIPFRDYVLATFVGIAPGTVVFVWLGIMGRAATTDSTDVGLLRWVLFGVGLLATVGVTVLIGRRTRTKLREMGIAEAP